MKMILTYNKSATTQTTVILQIACVECSLLNHACVICAAPAARQKLNRTDGFPVRDSDGLVLIGLSVCWGARDSYYISLQQEQSKGINTHTYMYKHTIKKKKKKFP